VINRQSGEGIWDEEDSQALRQARKDAEFTTSADSVRVYLKQIGKVALLNAADEVRLATQIEAGLYAAERVSRAENVTEKLSPQLRRDLRWIMRDGQRAKNICWRPTCAWSCRWPSATPGAACHSWT
jgi:RNA polymerase primary sigma factor